MKNIISNFLGALIATMVYWGLIQYTDTGTVDITKLILDPEPWLVSLVIAAGIYFWTTFFGSKDTDNEPSKT